MRIYFLLLILSFSCSSHTHKPSEELKNVKNHMRNESIYDESYAALSNYDGEMNKAFRTEFSFEGKVGDNFHFIGSSVATSYDGKNMDRKLLIHEAKNRALIKVFEKATDTVKVTTKVSQTNKRARVSGFVEARVQLRDIKGWVLTFDEYQCVVKKIPHPDLKYHFKRECKVILKIPESAFATGWAN